MPRELGPCQGAEQRLDRGGVAAHVAGRLGGAEEPAARTEQRKGAWISYTFWVTLPDDAAERPLREALQRVPGVVGQL